MGGTELEIILKAVDEASEPLKKVQTQLNELKDAAVGTQDPLGKTGNSMSESGEKAKTFAGHLDNLKTSLKNSAQMAVSFLEIYAGFKALEFGKSIITDTAEFEKSQQQLRANLDLTEAESKNVTDAIKKTMEVNPAKFQDLTEAYRNIGSEGFKGAEAITIMNEAAAKSVAVGDSVTNVARTVSVALHDYGKSAKDVNEYLGDMHEAMVQGNMTMPELSSAMRVLTGQAAGMGVQFKDVLSSQASLTKQGISSSQAATAIKNAMQSILTPHKNAEDAVKSLSRATGVDLVHDFSQAGLASKGLTGVFQDIMKATGGQADKLRALFPDQRAFADAIAEARDKGADMNKIFQSMPNGIGAMDNAVKQSKETFSYQLGIMQNWVERLKIAVGDRLIPVFKDLISWLTDHKEDLKKFGEDTLKFLVESFKLVAPVIGVVIGSLIQFVKWISDLHAPTWLIVTVIGVLGGILLWFVAPVAAVVLGITALIVALTWIWNISTPLRNALGSNFQAIWIGAAQLWTNVSKVFNDLKNLIGNFVKDMVNTGIDIFSGIVNGLKWGINMAIDIINKAIKGVNDITDMLNKGSGGLIKIDHIGTIPEFAVGSNYIPQDMLAMVHKGEKIVPASENTSNPHANPYTKSNDRPININVTMGGSGTKQDFEQLAKKLSYYLRLQ